jgi:outer membrane protein assembly factor BamC
MLTAHAPARLALIASACALTLLASGCSSISNLVSGDKIDYRSSGSKSVNLEVPPDLSQLTGQGRFTQSATGPVSANAYTQQTQNGTTAAASSVAANTVGNVTLQRDGQTRWLSVAAAPEQIYPVVREFWMDNGFELQVDQANTGLMETNWSENRAKLQQDGVRNLIGKVFDSLYDTGERDQFRTRVERTAKGTDIYISHRGLVEVYTDSVKKEQTTWKSRPADTGLEAEMLQRLMVKLGTPKDSAKAAVAANTNASGTPRSRVLADGLSVAFAGDYDQAWRRVGLALDRGGFTVEDRDRTKGFYEVRLASPGNPDGAKPGLFDKIGNLFGAKASADTITRYRLQVQATGGEATVAVQTPTGQPATGAGGRDVAKQLNINLE